MGTTDRTQNLTDRQQRFIDIYVVGLNARRAAAEAGYTGDDNALRVTGSNLLANPNVKSALQSRFREMIMTPEELLGRLTALAEADMSEFQDSEGNIDLLALKRAGLGSLVREISQTSQGSKLKLHDSMRAQELLAKYHQLLTDRVDITSNGKAIATEESIDRLSDIIARATDRDDA